MTRVSILPSYDNQNGWLEILGPRPEPNVLTGEIDADVVVIGAGFGGLAAARRTRPRSCLLYTSDAADE